MRGRRAEPGAGPGGGAESEIEAQGRGAVPWAVGDGGCLQNGSRATGRARYARARDSNDQ